MGIAALFQTLFFLLLIETQDGIDTRELAVGMTAGQLGEELGMAALPRYVLTVNARVAAAGTVLRSGDLIQVWILSLL